MKRGAAPAPSPTACDALAVGARLRTLRRQAGLTQLAVARSLGKTQSSVARLEAGRQRLSLQELSRIAGAIGCDVSVVIAQRVGA